MIPDRFRYKAGGDWCAVIVQDRYQANRVDAAFIDDERSQLGVAILLDYEYKIMIGHEAVDAGMEWKSADTHAIKRVAACLDHVNCLVHGR